MVSFHPLRKRAWLERRLFFFLLKRLFPGFYGFQRKNPSDDDKRSYAMWPDVANAGASGVSLLRYFNCGVKYQDKCHVPIERDT